MNNKLWNVLCTPTQWSCLEERILGLITLNKDGPIPQLLLTDYHRDYPFTIRDILIPTESVGFVYIIISKSNPNFTYIGQTQNISQRLDSHNRGHGAIDTACIDGARMLWLVLSHLLDWMLLLEWLLSRNGGYFVNSLSLTMILHMQSLDLVNLFPSSTITISLTLVICTNVFGSAS